MPTSDDEQLALLDPDLRAALQSYRDDGSAGNWTILSQMYCGELQVVDAVKAADPSFADPYPLAAADLSPSNAAFFQWPTLPAYGLVVRAVLDARMKHDRS